jgi:hypothetical protein
MKNKNKRLLNIYKLISKIVLLLLVIEKEYYFLKNLLRMKEKD